MLLGFTAIIMQAQKPYPDLALWVTLQRAASQLTPEGHETHPILAMCLCGVI